MGEIIDENDLFANEFFKRISPTGGALASKGDALKGEVLRTVMRDQEFARQLAPRGTIQAYTLRADTANKVLTLLGLEPVKVMAIGDIYPTPDVFEELKKIRLEAAVNSNRIIENMGPRGFSYFDLDMCKGHPDAREAMINDFSNSYGFSENPALLNKFIENSYIVSKGGMRGIELIFSAFLNKSLGENKTPRVIAPDNTFQMFWDIVDKINNSKRTQKHSLDTNQEDNLHLSPGIVREFYKENPGKKEDVTDLWYMIPVGNPSGTDAKTPEQLGETCREIIRNNPESVIVLDCAYLRTMEDSDANEVLRCVINDPEVMQRVIFIDSYSKTHSVPQERTGVIMSTSDDLFEIVANHDKVLTQGSPLSHSGLVMALHDKPSDHDRPLLFKNMQRFRRTEVQGLIDSLPNHPNLFHENQSHLGKAKGIYAFPRLADGVDELDVAAALGGLGIPFDFRSGRYLRLATGRIIEPTFSK